MKLFYLLRVICENASFTFLYYSSFDARVAFRDRVLDAMIKKSSGKIILYLCDGTLRVVAESWQSHDSALRSLIQLKNDVLASCPNE